jgi:hypothetical protein
MSCNQEEVVTPTPFYKILQGSWEIDSVYFINGDRFVFDEIQRKTIMAFGENDNYTLPRQGGNGERGFYGDNQSTEPTVPFDEKNGYPWFGNTPFSIYGNQNSCPIKFYNPQGLLVSENFTDYYNNPYIEYKEVYPEILKILDPNDYNKYNPSDCSGRDLILNNRGFDLDYHRCFLKSWGWYNLLYIKKQVKRNQKT